MRIVKEELMAEFYEGMKNMRRASWPAGDHISADGAEGGSIWHYNAEEDELTPGYSLGFRELAAADWEFEKA